MTRHKAVAAAIGAIVTVITAAMADSVVDIPEWGEIVSTAVVAGLGVYAVWVTPNRPTDSRTPQS